MRICPSKKCSDVSATIRTQKSVRIQRISLPMTFADLPKLGAGTVFRCLSRCRVCAQSATSPSSARKVFKDWVSRRETCICESPTFSAISD